MTLVKFEPTRELANWNRRIRKFFEDFDAPMIDSGFRWDSNVFTPRVDVTEDNENLYVEADLPGIDRNDVKVSVTGDVLTVSGERKSEQRDEKKNYYRIERSSGSFSRSFTLPAGVDSNKISAEFKDGVLKVTMPKTEEAKVVEKKIEIK